MYLQSPLLLSPLLQFSPLLPITVPSVTFTVPSVTTTVPSATSTVPSVTRCFFRNFPLLCISIIIKFVLLKCKLAQEGEVLNLQHIVPLGWEKTRQVCKIQWPLCYFISRLLPPCPLCYSPFSLFILFNHEDFYNHCSSFDSARKCFLKYDVSCFTIGYLLFASDKSVSFREA